MEVVLVPCFMTMPTTIIMAAEPHRHLEQIGEIPLVQCVDIIVYQDPPVPDHYHSVDLGYDIRRALVTSTRAFP